MVDFRICFFVFIFAGTKYVQEVFESVYKVVMKLTIIDVDIADFGMYKCVAKNSLGQSDGSIKLYREYFNLCKFYMIFFCYNRSAFL